MIKVTLIIPTKNEAEGIAKVISEIPKGYEVLVVDKSNDNTPGIASRLGAKVIKQVGEGKGNAMRLGAELAKGKILVFLDGDATYPAKEIPRIVKPILVEKADLVLGSRFKGKIHEMKPTHKIMNQFFSLIASILYRRTSDMLTGMRAIKKDCWKKLNLQAKGFEIETEIFIKACKQGLRIREVPIDYFPRLGKAKLSSLKDGYKILKTLIKGLFW
jgi:dolichol-phosphate mannosyltransferase